MIVSVSDDDATSTDRVAGGGGDGGGCDRAAGPDREGGGASVEQRRDGSGDHTGEGERGERTGHQVCVCVFCVCQCVSVRVLCRCARVSGCECQCAGEGASLCVCEEVRETDRSGGRLLPPFLFVGRGAVCDREAVQADECKLGVGLEFIIINQRGS